MMKPMRLGCTLPLALILAGLLGLVVLLSAWRPGSEPSPAAEPAAQIVAEVSDAARHDT